jgi:hypothetical protein
MQGETNRPVIRPLPRTHIDSIYAPNQPIVPQKDHKPKRLKWLFIAIAIVLVIAAAATHHFVTKNNNVLPLPIDKASAQTLGFDIYYPNQKLLPEGYVLDKKSFYYSNQTIIYSVIYGNNQKIIFSDQVKPSSADLQDFNAKNIPLHTTENTSIGTATLGAIGSQSIASLPTKTNAWLIITAPGDINQQVLDKVLNSVEIAK